MAQPNCFDERTDPRGDRGESASGDVRPSILAGLVAALVLMSLGTAGIKTHPGRVFDAWVDVSMPTFTQLRIQPGVEPRGM